MSPTYTITGFEWRRRLIQAAGPAAMRSELPTRLAAAQGPPRAAVMDVVGERASRHELPEARQGQVERGRRGARRKPDVEGERDCGEADDHPRQRARPRGEEGEGERPDEVVLLLHSERPEVQERRDLGRGGEVAGLAPQRDVGQEPGTSERMLAEQPVFIRQ